jgi:hypothetical protein
MCLSLYEVYHFVIGRNYEGHFVYIHADLINDVTNALTQEGLWNFTDFLSTSLRNIQYCLHCRLLIETKCFTTYYCL